MRKTPLVQLCIVTALGLSLAGAADAGPTPPATRAAPSAQQQAGTTDAGGQNAVAEVRGSLDKELIRGVIQRNIGGVKRCYEKELTTHPKLAGRIMVQFTIGTDGKVQQNATVQSSTMKAPNVENCIVQVVQRMEFPKPKNDIVVVTYPFVLTSSDEAAKPAHPQLPTPPPPT